jgi:aminopeptidase N
MFDAVSYNKGGRILNMLRNYVGDSAFFKALNLYLVTNKFKSAEAAQLRLAFEEVTGKDLNWFWNQWYYGNGHPKLEISYGYDEPTKTSSVFIKQTQTGDKVFRLPFAIDVYNGVNKTRYNVRMDRRSDTFTFKVPGKPDLINVDAAKILLAEKNDNKTLAEFVHQYRYAKKYVDRREAIDYSIKHLDQPEAKALLAEALNDPYFQIRKRVLQNVNAKELGEPEINKIISIAKADPYRTTRAAAIDALSELNRADLKSFYLAAAKDSSYSVAGAALEALLVVDDKAAIALLPELKKDVKGRLVESVKMVEVLQKGDADFGEMTTEFDSLSLFDKFNNYRNYLAYLGNVNNTENFKKGVDKIIEFRNIVAGYSAQLKETINNQLQGVKQRKIALKNKSNSVAGLDEQIAYIDQKVKD